MPWLTIAYSMTAAACVTLALVHLVIWLKQPAGRAHLLFSVTAVSVAAITPFELSMARAQTVGQFGSAVRWAHLPVALVVVSVVWFLWLHFRTGRLWLAYAVCGLRVLSLILNFSFTPNLNYREITGLRQVALFGGETASTAIGVASPWMLIGQLSLLLLLVYVVDASVALWRTGNRDSRRRAVIVGGGMVVFILGSAGHFVLILTGLIVSPFFLSFPFLAIVAAMGYELSLDVVKAGKLSLEVKASEQRLALAQEAGDIGTFDWDIRTGAVRWTEKLESIYGLPPGSFGGTFDSWRERVHPEDLPRCEAEINETIRQRLANWQTQYRMFRADNGEIRWIDARGRFFFDARSGATRMLGINIDITKRKQAEEAAHQSEERNRDILRAIPDLMFLQNAEGIYLDFHAKDPRDLLVPPAAFLGKNMRDVLPAELSEDFFRCFRRAQLTDEPQILEYALPIQDEERWFEARMVRSKGDQILSVVRDVTARKVAEAGLKDSEARLAGVIGSAMDAIISIDETQHVVLFNAAAEKMFSCSAREAIGQPLDHFIPERFRAAHKDHIRAFGKTNVTKRSMGSLMPIFGRSATGEDFPIEASISQIEFNGQNFYTVILRDITARLRAEEALRQSEERFRNMADTAPVMIWISGSDRLCTYFNKQWLDFTGRSIEQELGNGWAEGVHQDDYDRCLEIYNSAFDRREPFRMEYRLRRANGQFRWIYDNGAPRFSSDGEFLGYIGSCIDIAERKAAEDAVRAVKDELRLIADALPALVSEVDKNGHYRFNNLAYEKWFGQPLDQITGHHMREVLGEAVWKRISPQVEKALAGQEVHYEDFLPYRHGEPRWVSVAEIPTRDADGEVDGFVSLVADITETRRAEEALRDLSGRLINAQEEERSRVARELHDDLSQRMAVLSIGLEQIAQQTPQEPNNLHERIHSLLTETQEISTELHRVSYQLHPSKLDHLGLASAVKSFCEELGARHELNIKFQHQGFPASLSKDVTLCLFRIVQESLHNAAKHSGATGAQVVLEKTDQAVRLSVSDTGCGFDTESSKMTSGLGFISMRERLRLVGGQLSIRSGPSQGTTIEVSVPLMKEVESTSSGSSSRTANQSL